MLMTMGERLGQADVDTMTRHIGHWFVKDVAESVNLIAPILVDSFGTHGISS